MTTRDVVTVSATIETITGTFLIVDPTLVVHVLLNASLPGSGIAVGRLGGLGLLSLGLACWPVRESATHSTGALITYNLLAALYLGYLRVGGGFVSYLLWPACGLHALLTILLVRPAFVRLRQNNG